MSYLTLLQGVPDFSKAVFSLWFRVPKESVIAAAASSLGTGDFKHMQAVLPLVVFGKPQTNKNYVADYGDVAIDHTGAGRSYFTTYGYTAQHPYDVDPCYIGLLCISGKDYVKFNLTFNIQMGGGGTYGGIQWVTTKLDMYPPEAHPGEPVLGDGWVFGSLQATIKDVSYITNDQPEWFHVDTTEVFDPDVWHHVLLSFDINGLVSIGQPRPTSSCKLWYAIDDIDYRGPENLQPFRDPPPAKDGLGPNTIVTRNAWRESQAAPDEGYYFMNQPVKVPSGSYRPEAIPTGAKDGSVPLGIPAVVKYMDGIFKVEMAEFQMWTGVTLDTGIETNRRAFIDYERDADGTIIEDADGNTTLVPVNPVGQPPSIDNPSGEGAPAEKLLGKRPEILLHGSSDWIAGTNTGSLGIEIDTGGSGNAIPAGQFEPTGGIDPFTPDPSLTLQPETA